VPVFIKAQEQTGNGEAEYEVETLFSDSVCSGDHKIVWQKEKHKKTKFTVGVLGIRGPEEAFQEFNSTWNTYLTATAGRRFDPPIRFDMKFLDFVSLFTDTASAQVDFIYVNPSAYSCIESEYTARSLASQISRRDINDNVFNLQMFGGVIMARKDNTEVNHIRDLQGKRVAAASISGLGSGQMQFLEMQKAGMSYINDPGQLVFTSDQGKVVTGVLSGDFDVGFVRTDQIERTKNADGTLIDPKLFKIIDPIPDLKIGDMDFPFESSTPLYPEWNIASLSHVSEDVQRAVQQAILDLGYHADVQLQLDTCLEEATANNVTDTDAACPFVTIPRLRCDTTPELAQLAAQARSDGKYVSWSPTLSYMQLRSMQEVTGFISMDPADNTWKCTRSTTLYDSIACPVGYYKATEEQVSKACPARGFLDCVETDESYQCLCSPCVKIKECVDGVGERCIPYNVSVQFIVALLGYLTTHDNHFLTTHIL
jgi:ABC-type phosphate/phosphonate transport system substrate-binding protein